MNEVATLKELPRADLIEHAQALTLHSGALARDVAGWQSYATALKNQLPDRVGPVVSATITIASSAAAGVSKAIGGHWGTVINALVTGGFGVGALAAAHSNMPNAFEACRAAAVGPPSAEAAIESFQRAQTWWTTRAAVKKEVEARMAAGVVGAVKPPV